MQAPQEEMQQLILTCIEHQDFKTAQDCLTIYQNTFGLDSFYESCAISLLDHTGPEVMLIGLDVTESTIQAYLATETYRNLAFVNFSGNDYIRDLASFLPSCRGKEILPGFIIYSPSSYSVWAT